MSAPALVLFDLDDVLVRYSHAERIGTMARRTGTTPEAVHRALFESGVELAADRGQLDVPGTLMAFAGALGTPVTLDDWIHSRGAGMTPIAEVQRLAKQVSARAQVAILTNNGLLLRDYLGQMHPSLFPLFAGRVFCSAQFRRSKPDPDIYRDCLSALGVPAADTLFIDDKAANADGARSAGLKAHHFRDADGLRAELLALDLLEPAA